ncbi:DNA-directed RNA polymerases I, II, and III subunit RPABC4, putative [Plasmodium ovale]|uniref:DNA-directed RNA polymerases I, II, and III subunit RPABC4, putative n=1 Tax=Plasmodium ovale TaxID=36330 RepID=A0A1D3TKA9_PLAOA|nr:DNA-directed RNA polymerases I, II, and III subunit RPABC4, putative [Plasmodium ovale]
MYIREDDEDISNEPVIYVCGECGIDTVIPPNASLRCKNCGSKIFFKKRSRRVMQYEAR